MKPRTSLLLAVIAVVVLAVGLYFGTGQTPERHFTAGTLVFPGLTAKLQDAARLEISNQGKTLVVAKRNDVWGLADRGYYPVEADKLREILSGLTELRLTEPRTSDPTHFAVLGVDDPNGKTSTANLLRVFDAKGGLIAELIVGHRRVRTRGDVPESIYVRRPGENQAWLAEGRLPVDADPQLWLERDIANIPIDKVADVTVHRGDETLVFRRDGTKTVLESPADHPKLDDYKIEDVFRGLENLTLTDVRPIAGMPGAKIGDASYVTTDGLTLAIAVFKDGKDIWTSYTATGKDPSGLQARLSPWAFQVGSWKEQAFAPTLADLKATEEAPAAAGAAPQMAPAPGR